MDIYYMTARVKEILHEKFQQIDYSDETILKLRKALLKSTIQEAQKRKAKKPNKKDERAMRCEPVVRRIVEEILNEDLLLSDDDYFKDAVSNDDQLLLRVLSNSYVDAIDNWLEMFLRENKRKSDLVLYNGKEPEELTWGDLNRILS